MILTPKSNRWGIVGINYDTYKVHSPRVLISAILKTKIITGIFQFSLTVKHLFLKTAIGGAEKKLIN